MYTIYMNMNYKTIIIFLALLGAVACASIQTELEQLDKSMFAYERALRWQNYDTVFAFHKNEYQNLTRQKRKTLKRFRVTAYDEVYRRLENEGQAATQVVEIKYYNDEYAVIKNMTLKNQWEYDKASGRWYLTNPFPDFK